MTTKKTWGEALQAELQTDPEFILEVLVLRMNGVIRRRMHELGLSQTDLAAKLGVSQPGVSKLLNYNANLTLRSLVRIAHALDAKWTEPELVSLASGDHANAEGAVVYAFTVETPPKQLFVRNFVDVDSLSDEKECVADGLPVAVAA